MSLILQCLLQVIGGLYGEDSADELDHTLLMLSISQVASERVALAIFKHPELRAETLNLREHNLGQSALAMATFANLLVLAHAILDSPMLTSASMDPGKDGDSALRGALIHKREALCLRMLGRRDLITRELLNTPYHPNQLFGHSDGHTLLFLAIQLQIDGVSAGIMRAHHDVLEGDMLNTLHGDTLETALSFAVDAGLEATCMAILERSDLLTMDTLQHDLTQHFEHGRGDETVLARARRKGLTNVAAKIEQCIEEIRARDASNNSHIA